MFFPDKFCVAVTQEMSKKWWIKPLLLLADTRNFNIFNNLEINRITHDYNQSALVINLKLDNPVSEKIAFQRFADNQIQGLLPISSNEFNLIWSINSSEVDNLSTSVIKPISYL